MEKLVFISSCVVCFPLFVCARSGEFSVLFRCVRQSWLECALSVFFTVDFILRSGSWPSVRFPFPPLCFHFLPLSTPDINRFSFCCWPKVAFIPLFDFTHKSLFWSCSVASGFGPSVCISFSHPIFIFYLSFIHRCLIHSPRSCGRPFDFHLSIQERIASFPVGFLAAGRRCTGASRPLFVTPARHCYFSLLARTFLPQFVFISCPSCSCVLILLCL
jgi:hypothetical protein